jgi:hypothetical protein
MTTSFGYCLYLYITHFLVLLRRLGYNQEVTKRCRLSWLTNSDLAYEHRFGGGAAESQPMSTAVHTEPK